MENLSEIKELKKDLELIKLARNIANEQDFVPSKEEADEDADWYIENIDDNVEKTLLIKSFHKYENASCLRMEGLYEDICEEIINLI